jgi:hypothetical protein
MVSFNIPANETPEQAQLRMRADQMRVAASHPTDMASGIDAVTQALMLRQRQQQALFPATPGGEKPSMMTGFKNMFGLGGGLY